MKKGIIVELKGKEKVILADNGRFYVATLKSGEHIGSDVKFYPARKKIVSLILIAFIAVSSYYGGVFVVASANSNVCESLVQIESGPSAEFLLNSKGKVLSVAPLDKVSAMLIAGEDFRGMDAKSAVSMFVGLALECGYISLDKENAFIIYGAKSEGSFNTVSNSICSGLESYFSEKSIKAVVLEDVSRPGLSALMTMFNCGTGKLRVLYEAAKIEQLKGDKRDTFELMQILNGIQLKKVLDIIRQGHITYNQHISPELKEAYIMQKESIKAVNSLKLSRYQNDPGYISGYNIWLGTKSSNTEHYMVNSGAGFMVPCYVSEN